MDITNENAEQRHLPGLIKILLVSVSYFYNFRTTTILYTFSIAQMCNSAYPSVKDATSRVVQNSPSNNTYMVNTTVIYTCPDNSTRSTTCSYRTQGGTQWIPNTLDACPVVGKNIWHYIRITAYIIHTYVILQLVQLVLMQVAIQEVIMMTIKTDLF